MNFNRDEGSNDSSPLSPVQTYDLKSLPWTVAGYWPTSWTGKSMELGFGLQPEVPSVPANVPGSVQGALSNAGILSDWFQGLDSRKAEWVEHREWMYSTTLPDHWFKSASHFVLKCEGLDGNGLIVFNKKIVGRFDNAFTPYRLDLTGEALPAGNELHLIFCLVPRWLGQVGYTSQMKEWKPRFNYGWDWTPRIVQIGPWEPVTLTVSDDATISSLRVRSDWDLEKKRGKLWIKGTLDQPPKGSYQARISLQNGAQIVRIEDLSPEQFAAGVEWTDLAVEPWWPNGMGEHKLYTLRCDLLGAQARTLDSQERRVGFKHIAWQACANAPAQADPWICVVNGEPVFLQGVNWTPIRPTFADLTFEDYRKLIHTYVTLGANVFRVWGGAFLEKQWFYDLCDENGVLVWQEFPLSSSGHENWPHEDEPSMDTLVKIAESYIERRQHHVSLLLWCGGNELQGAENGGKVGIGKPVGMDHPLMIRWKALVDREDPGRRFLPTSSSGPTFMANEKNFGQGVHWDVHGPWRVFEGGLAQWENYWNADDALFRSETGSPGTSSVEMISRYSGGLALWPANMDNPLWRRFSWWNEWADFQKEKARDPQNLEEYVEWSQGRQAAALAIAARACKARFPGIGGFIVWMGHDSFPCLANTSIIDFDGRPKPAGVAISEIWKTASSKLKKQA